MLALGVLWLLLPVVRQELDIPFEAMVNHMARRSPWFDYGVGALDRSTLFQGVALMALACGLLVRIRDDGRKAQLVLGCLFASAAAAVSRGVQWVMPQRPRPLYDEHLDFIRPWGADPSTWQDWSSFPSDHAALLFGLASAIAVADLRLGALAFGWASSLGLARMYEGYHYLSDTVGGWLLGVCVVVASSLVPVRPLGAAYQRASRHSLWFGAALFIYATQAADMFDEVRNLASAFVRRLL